MMPEEHLVEVPGGMTWQEVKDFLDHIRTTCMDDRQMWKERARKAEAEVARLTALIDGGGSGE